MARERVWRYGYTTGTCAAAAAKAAVACLFHGQIAERVKLVLPGGAEVEIPVEVQGNGDEALAVVVKDAGDDPDITHGAKVVVSARQAPAGIKLLAGEGVGTVTLPGLPVPVGEPAINPVPRAMIEGAVRPLLPPDAGVELTISIPGGEELARRTLNPKLGIRGGLSILGTTGLVRPMSEEAFRESLLPQLDVAVAAGHKLLVLTPGGLGQAQAVRQCGLPPTAVIQTSNFIGFMLQEAVKRGVRRLVLWGHAGKLVKVAAGIFHTHSRVADARLETVAAWAAAMGAGPQTVRRILEAPTMEAVNTLLEEAGLSAVWSVLAAQAGRRATAYVAGEATVGAVLLDRQGRILGLDAPAARFLGLSPTGLVTQEPPMGHSHTTEAGNCRNRPGLCSKSSTGLQSREQTQA